MQNIASEVEPLDTVLAGPILRQARPQRLVLWLAAARQERLALALYREDDGRRQVADDTIPLDGYRRDLRIGEHAWLVFIDIDLAAAGIDALPEGCAIGYDLLIGGDRQSLAQDEPGLCYEGEARPRFVIKTRLDSLLHGSCRRPHHPSGDGMARADRWLAERRSDSAD
jgi:hypothetical protein